MGKLRVSERAGVAKACRLKQVQGLKQGEELGAPFEGRRDAA